MDDVADSASTLLVTYYIYVILNRVTGWIYVGKTKNPSTRWRRHIRRTCNSHLRASMSKHGVENFEFELIESYPSEHEAYKNETFWIAYLRSIGAQLYNQNEGGRGGTNPSQEVRNKLACGRRGKKATLESRERMRLAQLGKKQSPERVAQRVEKIRGTKRSLESRERSRQGSMHRRKLTDEQVNVIQTSTLSIAMLARQHGVSDTLIRRIRQAYAEELQAVYPRR